MPHLHLLIWVLPFLPSLVPSVHSLIYLIGAPRNERYSYHWWLALASVSFSSLSVLILVFRMFLSTTLPAPPARKSSKKEPSADGFLSVEKKKSNSLEHYKKRGKPQASAEQKPMLEHRVDIHNDNQKSEDDFNTDDVSLILLGRHHLYVAYAYFILNFLSVVAFILRYFFPLVPSLVPLN